MLVGHFEKILTKLSNWQQNVKSLSQIFSSYFKSHSSSELIQMTTFSMSTGDSFALSGFKPFSAKFCSSLLISFFCSVFYTDRVPFHECQSTSLIFSNDLVNFKFKFGYLRGLWRCFFNVTWSVLSFLNRQKRLQCSVFRWSNPLNWASPPPEQYSIWHR